jgi:arylsulfatase A-like enzyme
MTGVTAATDASNAPAPVQRPNIVLVVIDDATPTDLGAYGSEIATPNIDALAASGARFTNFHATPMCAPSRAMLLTGIDSHLAGIANLPETVPQSHEGKPGYLGRLGDNVVTIASLLQRDGYRTYAAGKWHLGHTPGALPDARGFDRSFVVDATGADNWEQRPYLPIYADADWFEDGKPVRLPQQFYSSEFLVTRAIEYVGGDARDGKPFFLYLPFLAIHIPVQAPQEFTDRYAQVYSAGWEAQRQRRYDAAVRMGLVAPGTAVRPLPAGLREWTALNADQRLAQARAQAVSAGMMEAMDHHLGRLIAHLRRIGAFDNTLFVVLADNGPEPGDPVASPLFRLWMKGVGYSTDIDRLGTRGTFAAIGPEAAKANAEPFALFKFHAAEGGLRVPLIVAGPGVRPAQRLDVFAFITDLAPTLLAYAGTEPAASPSPPLSGHSLTALLAGKANGVYASDEAVGMEAAGASALFKGSMKLVRDRPPFGDEQWHLYDLASDPGETNDLAAARPAVLQEMLADYEAYAARVGVLEVPPGYNTTAEVSAKMLHALVQRHRPAIAGTVLALIVLIGWGLWRWVAWRRRAR